MIDIAIVGCGPAGLSAAVNIAARNREAVILARKMETSAIWKAEKVSNHIGMPDMTGKEMMTAFMEHIKAYDIKVREGRVLQIMPVDNHFMINFENDFIDTRAVILATGIEKGVKIKGEEKYLGNGVSYCATCDGMLYRNKNVIVIAETEEGAEDANFLSEICGKIYYVNKYGSNPKLNEKIEILDKKITEIIGGEFVEGVLADNEKIAVDGVFFIKASTPPGNIIYGLNMENNSIIVNRQMETSIKGVFACGDNTGKPYQLSKAIGEGQIAGQAAVRYLNIID